MLLYYILTHSNDILRYYPSDICLHIDTVAAYLVDPGSNSGFSSYFYLGSNSTKISPQSSQLNAPIHVLCKLLKHVVSSATKAETGGLFENCQAAIPLRHMLAALNHSQPYTIVKTDNFTAADFSIKL